MAMQDAFELSECLSDNEFKNIRDAVAKYESQMKKGHLKLLRIL